MLARLTRVAVDFLRREDGPTSVEYAVMLALILAVIVSVTSIGNNTSTSYANPTLQNAAKPSGS